MGTNYYWHIADKKIHIGKASGGWRFLFREYQGLGSIDDWAKALKVGYIVDEYERVINWWDLFRRVLGRQEDEQHKNTKHHFYCDFDDGEFS